MDMELRAITVKTGIQRSAREDFRAMHKADAALFPRVARLQRTRGLVSSALLRLGGWLAPRTESARIAPESQRQITPA
jgi:hypothetical protein